ncbi:MAG: hypothetical protein ACE5KE_03945 [Methanosarcinales archaeon]
MRENHLKEAKKLYQKALEEFENAKEKKDGIVLRDACGKGWLSTIEATNALLIKKGVKDEELPRSERGRRYMVFKYGGKDFRLLYLSLRDSLHIQGYYDGTLNFEEMEEYLEDLNFYIKKIEELNLGSNKLAKRGFGWREALGLKKTNIGK